MEPIILASGSPRRQEYFKLMGLPFCIMPSTVEERFEKGADPQKTAEDLALQKVKKILDPFTGRPPLWITGVDTLISLDREIYGKPPNEEEARRMLKSYRAREHEVITAIALFNGKDNSIDCRSVTSTVCFGELSDGELDWYISQGEWQGAAGAYKIQGLAGCFITGIKGSYSSIVGLPLREFYVMLRDNGYPYGKP
ncbi:MAG: Maf family protein [Treponema sp.]|jgi:septum formation protein|nr:Maf family protein [Treponema sp.]